MRFQLRLLAEMGQCTADICLLQLEPPAVCTIHFWVLLEAYQAAMCAGPRDQYWTILYCRISSKLKFSDHPLQQAPALL